MLQFYGTLTIRNYLTVTKTLRYLRVKLVSLEARTGLCSRDDDLVTMWKKADTDLKKRLTRIQHDGKHKFALPTYAVRINKLKNVWSLIHWFGVLVTFLSLRYSPTQYNKYIMNNKAWI